MAGYSGTPLPQKLGIKPNHRVALLGAPPGFTATLGALPAGARTSAGLSGTRAFDVIVWFVDKARALDDGFARVKTRLDPAGGLWIAWPKKASGVVTDVTESLVRATALAGGLVDNKVCAVDDTWSGLRCVVRVKDRPPSPAKPNVRR